MKFPKIECPICGTTNVEFFTADDDEEPKKIQFFPNESISTKNNSVSKSERFSTIDWILLLNVCTLGLFGTQSMMRATITITVLVVADS